MPTPSTFAATTTTFVHVTTTVGHSSAASGPDLPTWLTAVFTGLLLLAAIGAGWLAVRAYVHDRARAGVGSYVMAFRLFADWAPRDETHVPGPMPPDWKLENVRYVAVRLQNLADYDTVVWFRPEHTRCGWLRRRVAVLSGTRVALPAKLPQSFMVLLHRSQGWGERKRVRVRLVWETTTTTKVKLSKRMALKPLPDAETWARIKKTSEVLELPPDARL